MLEQVLGPRFGNDIWPHSTVLRRSVVSPRNSDKIHKPQKNHEPKAVYRALFVRILLDIGLFQDPLGDEATAFPRSTVISYKGADHFEC